MIGEVEVTAIPWVDAGPEEVNLLEVGEYMAHEVAKPPLLNPPMSFNDCDRLFDSLLLILQK